MQSKDGQLMLSARADQMDESDRSSASDDIYDLIDTYSVGESEKLVTDVEGRSGKIIPPWCCFPPKFANPGTLVFDQLSIAFSPSL